MTYNDKHKDKKYEANLKYLQDVNPKSILDLYAGPKSFYKNHVEKVVSNDLNYGGHEYQNRAELVLADLYAKKKRFDIVDLDPFGSAFPCFEMAVQVAKIGLVVTFGELGHKRWKRTDYTRRTYRIYNAEDLSLISFSAYIDEVARRYKKRAVIHSSYNWHNIGRVYFLLQDLPKQPPRI